MPGQLPIIVDVKLRPTELYWASVFITARQLRKVLWIFGIMGLLFVALFAMSWLRPRPEMEWYESLQNSKPLLWIFAFPLVMVFGTPLLTSRKFLADKRNDQGVRFEFLETGILIETSVGKTDLKWAAFLEALETKSTFFLFPTRSLARIVPKRCLTNQGEVESLRELLRCHIPKHRLLQS